MTHIRNGHQQAPAALGIAPAALGGGLAIDGVVEITRVLAVDGHQRHIGEVDAVIGVLRSHLVGQAARLRDAGLGELVRHAVLAHRDLDLHARVIDLAQYFLDAAHRLAVERGRLDQLDHHHLACLGLTRGALGDQDVLAVALVLGGDEPDAALLQQAADDGLWGTLEDLEHPTLGPALAVETHDACLDAVLVQHGPHLVGWQVDVGLAVITHHETMAIAMSADGSFEFFQQAAGVSNILDIQSYSCS